MPNIDSTVALSLLIHGEAVRLNRGKTQGDNYDFKYLSDGRGNILPYVSSQCFKKYWRETLPQPYSPITRGKNAAGSEKNQVYTDGNPITYVDDDLFGYMRAGANSEEAQSDSDQNEDISPEQADAEIASRLFEPEDFQDKGALLTQFKKGKGEFYQKLQERVPNNLRDEYNRAGKDISDELLNAMIEALNLSIREPGESGHALKGADKKAVESSSKTHSQVVSEFIAREFGKALRPPLPTTKRTSPIRMHALVAFSGVSMAKDFQTFARDIAYTGKNAVLNPSTVGIYSGWLKTRILIEGQRIGKFYLGENREMTHEQIKVIENAPEPQSEVDPYSRKGDQVSVVQMDTPTRTMRLQYVLRALADIGNRQGPASGALHDGSLRPKGFIGAFMNCADSPFDAVWQGTDIRRENDDQHETKGLPYLDVRRLKAVLLDWEDLFVSKTIYIGYPIEMRFGSQNIEEILKSQDMKIVADQGFTFIVDTPRKALLKMVEDAAL